MLNKKVIRIIAIVMAALMVLGVLGGAISTFAIDSDYVAQSIPKTGQTSMKLPIIIAVISLLAVILCIVMSPKKKTKKPQENVENDYINEDDVESGLNFFTSKKQDVYIEKPEENEESSDSENIEE